MKQLVIAASILMLGGAAEAAPDMSTVANCQTVESCITLIDSALVPGNLGIDFDETEEVTQLLKSRFGEPMRRALIERAANGSEDWVNYAGAMLSIWGDWDASYLPVLKPAFDRDPGGWLARVIGEIGTDEALDYLIEGIAISGTNNQAGFAIRNFPDEKILDRVLPYLEPTGAITPGYPAFTIGRSSGIKSLIRSRTETALTYLPKWRRIALNEAETDDRRIAALRAIAAIGPSAFKEGPALRHLANEPAPIGPEATQTLLDITDSSVAQLAFSTCKEQSAEAMSRGSQFDVSSEDPYILEICLDRMALYGPRAADAFEDMEVYVAHPDRAVRAVALETLAYTGLPKAIPFVEGSLTSRDWREVLSALHGLAILDAAESVEKINDVAETHWWSEIRYFAKQAIEFIEGSRVEWTKSPTSNWGGIFIGLEEYVGSGPVNAAMTCNWARQSFQWPDTVIYTYEHELAVPGGTLIGIDSGEFGGELIFRPDEGEEVVLWRDNIIALFNDGDDIIALSGLSHLSLRRGHAVRVEKEDGKWQVHFIGQFPAEPERYKYLGNNQYAILADGWPVIFDAEDILGVAECETADSAY